MMGKFQILSQTYTINIIIFKGYQGNNACCHILLLGSKIIHKNIAHFSVMLDYHAMLLNFVLFFTKLNSNSILIMK